MNVLQRSLNPPTDQVRECRELFLKLLRTLRRPTVELVFGLVVFSSFVISNLLSKERQDPLPR